MTLFRPKTLKQARARIAEGSGLVTDRIKDGPHAACGCDRCTIVRELQDAGYWLAPGQIWAPPGSYIG